MVPVSRCGDEWREGEQRQQGIKAKTETKKEREREGRRRKA
jgi:hypothetical protein